MLFPQGGPARVVLEDGAAANRVHDQFSTNAPQQQPELAAQTVARYSQDNASFGAMEVFHGDPRMQDGLDWRTVGVYPGLLDLIDMGVGEHDRPEPGGLLHMEERYTSPLLGLSAQQQQGQMQPQTHGTSASPWAVTAAASAVSSTHATNATRKEPRQIQSSVQRTKAFVCPLFSCGRMFTRKEHLRRHLRTHTLGRPYRCQRCNRTFQREENLKRHFHIYGSTCGPSSEQGTGLGSEEVGPESEGVTALGATSDLDMCEIQIQGQLREVQGDEEGLVVPTGSVYPTAFAANNVDNRQDLHYGDSVTSQVVSTPNPFAFVPPLGLGQPYNSAFSTASQPPPQTSASPAPYPLVSDIRIPLVSQMRGRDLKCKGDAENPRVTVARLRASPSPKVEKLELRHTRLEPSSSLGRVLPADAYLRRNVQDMKTTLNSEEGWWTNDNDGAYEASERGEDDESLLQSELSPTLATSMTNSWKQDPNPYMLSIIGRLLLSNRKLDVHILDVLRRCQRSPSPYGDLIRLCTSDSSDMKELSDIVLCAMQQSHDDLIHQLGSVGKGRFVKRMLIKVSQKIGAIPSSLFVQGVSCAEMNRREGMGGFADVFRGSKDGREVALKLLRISNYLVAKQEWKRPFYREALLWRQLRHENILEFIGLDKRTFDGSMCMVSPWMANGDIARLLATNDHKLTCSLKCKWILEVIAGLSYLHDEGVVHGDFRGANILLDDHLTAQIADFGLSMLLDAGMSTMGVTSRREGAVRWTASEVLDSGQCTPEGDVYSFGCVCLEIFSEACPYPDLKNDRQVIHQVGRGRRPEWRTKCADDAHAVADALGNIRLAGQVCVAWSEVESCPL